MYRRIETQLRKILIDRQIENLEDSAHDLQHTQRVVGLAHYLAEGTDADLDVLIPAAWLHDIVNFPKQSECRKSSSAAAATLGIEILSNLNYVPGLHSKIAHAIEAHSFSAGIQALSIEAKILQDADRLDALGAHGLVRCLLVGNSMGIELYDQADPFAATRSLDDKKYSLDHFQTKLFLLPEKMNTAKARHLARRRVEFLKQFMEQLGQEIAEASGTVIFTG